jgi:hypothetical protein
LSTPIPRIDFPELFFGFVAPIGADLDETVSAFRNFFLEKNYRVIELKVTDMFDFLREYFPPNNSLSRETPIIRYDTYIAYGNKLRESLGDDILARFIINRITESEHELISKSNTIIPSFCFGNLSERRK